MVELHIKIRKRIARLAYGENFVSYNEGYKIIFDFDKEWDSIKNKTARFIFGENYIDYPFNGNEVEIPLIKNADTLEIGVYSDNLYTTTAVKFKVLKSIKDEEKIEILVPEAYPEIKELDDEDLIRVYDKSEEKIGISPLKKLFDKTKVAIDDALTQAKASGEFDGADGKSAYSYAQDGGYTGTEAEFAAKLAAESIDKALYVVNATIDFDTFELSVDKTFEEIKQAYDEGKYSIVLSLMGASIAPLIGMSSEGCVFARLTTTSSVGVDTVIITKDNVIETRSADLATTNSKLPNPYPLTFTGAVSGSYDGSAPLSVEIPSGGSGGEGATSNYVELGTLPYTVGNITELYLEPSADCSLVIGSGNDNNLITSLKDSLTSSGNPVIDNLLSEEYSGTHTVKLIATNTNAGNSFYDVFDVTGLTVGTEYTFSCTVGLSGISGSAYGRVALGAGTQFGTYGGVYGKADGERISLTFTASNTTVRIQLYIWTGYAVAVGDAITYSDCLLCEGTSTEFGTSVTYELSAGNKTKLSFAEGTEIPAVDGVTITVYKLVEGVAGDLFVFLGDSIPCFDSNTGGIGAIPDYLREKCGGTWKNFCVGGTTMSAYRTTGNGYEYFTLDEWADSIATGDFANQAQGVTDGASSGSTSYSLTKKVSDAQALDWSAVKCVFFAFGTNDLAYGVSEVGASTDAATKHGSMCAALKYAVQTIQATYPIIKIVVCGIIYRHADNPSVSAIIAANDAIRSTCESIGVPFVPLFENMGVNEWNQTAFLYDGTHPNAAGKERYADTVKRLLCL